MNTSMCNINNYLEIFIVTYNRKKYLKNTLDQILSDTSPVKNYKITILDNCSNDGSSELINEYIKKFSNIKHIIHNHNIGGNANICRAFELSTYPYVWILCDDDEYSWEHWDEVEKAIISGKDLIVVANYCKPKLSDVNLIKQLTFVPAGIYKTSHFSDGMMINAYYNISTMFPQIAIASVYINKNLNIYICNYGIVNMVTNHEDCSYVRGVEGVKPHPYMKNNYWQFGFATAIQLFEDNTLREKLTENINLEEVRGREGYFHMLGITRDLCNNNIRNLTELFCALNSQQRKEFIESIINFYPKDLVAKYLFSYISYSDSIKNILEDALSFKKKAIPKKIINITKDNFICELYCGNFIKIRIWDRNWIHLRRTPKGVDIVLFNKIKIRIWSPKWIHLHKINTRI